MIKIKKILLFLVIFILSITLTACNEKTEPIPKKQLELPTTEKVKAKDETIYTILDEDSKVLSIKAVNHISDVTSNYYLDYGVFNKKGNNNLSFSAPILMSEGLAKVPVLENIDNFYYELSLNKDYYYSRLPYDIKISYKLNEKPVTANELANKEGKVVIILDVLPNKEAEQYFVTKYMAQIQVPININNNKIIEAAGTNARVLVGSTVNLAYTVMPGSSAHYEIRIESNNFKFDGIQATYQPISYASLIDNIDLDISEQINQISLVTPAINEIKNYGFNPVIRATEPLFTNLDFLTKELENFLSNDNIKSISEIKALENLKNLFIVPTTLVNTEITNYEEVMVEIMNFYQTLEESLDEFMMYSNTLGDYLNQLVSMLPRISFTVDQLNNNYQYLLEANNKLDILKSIFYDLEPLLASRDLITLIKNIDEYTSVIEQIKIIKVDLENDLANLVATMALSPNQISSVIEIVIEFFTHINNFVSSIESFKIALSEYGVYLKTNQLSYFKPDIESQTKLGACLGVIYGDEDENIGLITKLEFINNQITLENLEDIEVQIALLKNMLMVDSETDLRPVDQIPLSFIALNNSLNVSSSKTDMSFFSSLDLIVSNFVNLSTIKSLISPEEIPSVSFLSNKNQEPNSVQFIVRQQPIS